MQQLHIFNKPMILGVPNIGILQDEIQQSFEILKKAMFMADPYAVCVLVTGGDDSLTALKIAMMFGVKIDYIIHGVTGTGLKDVRLFVNSLSDKHKIKLLTADAGSAFEDYVNRKGFFGVGHSAHSFSYHILKTNPFDRTISKYIRKGVSRRNIILINGVRVEESENRADNYGDNPFRWQGRNLWVNIAHWFTKKQCLELLSSENEQRSPVSIALGRSGECNCGTMQNEASRIACSEYDPEWGLWMKNLRKHIVQKFGFDIHQNPNKKTIAAINKASEKINEFMPMCVGCKANARAGNMFEI
ncbi:hypothetical protein [Pedobacter sp. Hv1]|uniref:hypothetical protein n=1 Tax=Pedobacter sp. Hv1 TaxID=1740090 RepID=UPI0006D8C3DB|nr:hypothetical protein [Pedobacter sp. Hv1]KQC02066.1 hypothetical protein AQF98_00390 [Pedobacter sp. Hv1]